ncbi:hypothetical protein [Flavicella sediminum]|uniref:hypothetical protein n=1 Tax=Flavicella sediminum TaxID=2585141 RepID=UPI0011211DF1|nr:hypothetical protein [Flavicella sediminum]
MDKKVAEYIDAELKTIAILDEHNVGFEGVKIYDFRTHHENGEIFKHQNGETYGMAFLNAITQESANLITREIKKNKNLSLYGLREFVDRQRLKCYVKGGSRSYDSWKTGDVGVAYLEFDDEKRIILPRFKNESVED